MNLARPKCPETGFTLLEIMIIVAIIGMLAALAMPAFIKVRKQSQAKRIINDARIIDTAVDSWALDNGKTNGETVVVTELAEYTKAGAVRTNDVLGNTFTIGPVGTNQVQVASATKSALSGVSVDWGSY